MGTPSRKLLRFVRRVLGTEHAAQRQQLEHQRHELGVLKLLLFQTNSLLRYSLVGEQNVRSSVTYKRCTEIVSLLSPMDVQDGTYVRVGRDFDGGYVMLDNFHKENVDAAYSFGINNDVSWDEAVAGRGIDVFMFDHTIEGLPKHHPRFHYFKTGVAGRRKGEQTKTLSELLADNNHATCNNLLMKMDIEGGEWDVFDETPSDVIGRFSQIVLELHELSPDTCDRDYLSKVNVLKKINQTHQCVHVHANTYCLQANARCVQADTSFVPVWIGDLVLPPMLEVTYVRRADVKDKLVANTRLFPTRIDQPTFEGLPDLYLGSFQGPRSEHDSLAAGASNL